MVLPQGSPNQGTEKRDGGPHQAPVPVPLREVEIRQIPIEVGSLVKLR